MGVAAEQIQIDRVPSDLFSLLGVAPILGRPILPQDMQPGNDHVAILSYKLWMDDFGGDTHIVGRKITIDQKSYIVIGVMPAEFGLGIFYHSFELEFGLPGSGRIWEPVLPSQEVHQTTVAAGKLVARLKDGATLAQLNAQLRPLSERFAADFPPGSTGVSIFAQRLNPGIPSSVSVPLIILFAAVGFVLLMACVNVASLLVGRSWSRQRELTIRRTLGATRFRIVRQLLCESLLLAIAGGALGLFFSIWGIRVLRAVAPPYSPRVEYIRLDANVLWFTLAASLLTAILIGLTPALHATSRRVGAKLKGGLSGSFAETTMRQSRVFRSSLVVLELALAMIVVVGGALMARSFYRLMILNAVVRPSHVVTMQVRYSDSPCSDRKSVTACVTLFALDAIARIRSLPGIQQAALASCGGPFTGGRQIGHYPGSGRVGLYIEGLTGDQLPSAGLFMLDVGSITPGYFASLGVPIVKGRDFNWGDLAGPPAVIVSESFA
ncbi:MAG TPA: ABC transporter permease, partial [Nitrospira sp.]|nr:ABC transporter permease [Nitrospira sp.]